MNKKNIDNIDQVQTLELINNISNCDLNNYININDKYKKNLDCLNNVIDLNNNICIVDLSYMTFTRFFAVRRWYEIKMKTDRPDWKIPDNYNWTEDKIFMEKFDKLFFHKLFKLCQNKNIPIHNIIFTIDCKHSNNWRVLSKETYKETRKDSHIKNKFHNFDIFPYVRHNLIKELQEESRNIVIKHDNLEADDLVAIIIEHLKYKNYNKNIIIMSYDKDYVQLCDEQIICSDLNGKSLSHKIFETFKNGKEYLIYKILFGDISDNIKPCYISKEFLKICGIKTQKQYIKGTLNVINKLINNTTGYPLLEKYLEYSRDINVLNENDLYNKWSDKINILHNITKNRQFEHNAKLIDFQNIPINYKLNIFEILKNLI